MPSSSRVQTCRRRRKLSATGAGSEELGPATSEPRLRAQMRPRRRIPIPRQRVGNLAVPPAPDARDRGEERDLNRAPPGRPPERPTRRLRCNAYSGALLSSFEDHRRTVGLAAAAQRGYASGLSGRRLHSPVGIALTAPLGTCPPGTAIRVHARLPTRRQRTRRYAAASAPGRGGQRRRDVHTGAGESRPAHGTTASRGRGRSREGAARDSLRRNSLGPSLAREARRPATGSASECRAGQGRFFSRASSAATAPAAAGDARRRSRPRGVRQVHWDLRGRGSLSAPAGVRAGRPPRRRSLSRRRRGSGRPATRGAQPARLEHLSPEGVRRDGGRTPAAGRGTLFPAVRLPFVAATRRRHLVLDARQPDGGSYRGATVAGIGGIA